jgi:putative PIN family toxin of toxin-antitoxin system
MRVALDTNVLISALHSSAGNPAEIFRLALTGDIQLFSSQPLLKEFREVLSEKFEWPGTAVERAASVLSSLASMVELKERILAIHADDADNRVLECAVAARADVLVTGDRRHLLPLRELRGIKIISLAEFLQHFRTG